MNPHLRPVLRTPYRAFFAALLTLWAAFVTSPVAEAQLLEYEGFNYTGTTLIGQNGGTGWGANAWANTNGNAALSGDGVSLTAPALVTNAPIGSRLLFTGPGVVERTLGTSMALTNEGTTFFFSARVKYQGAFKFEFWDATVNARWRIGATNDGQSGLIGVAAPETKVSGIFPENETVFVVAKMLTHTTAVDQAFMSVYRAADIVPAQEPGVWQGTGTTASGVILTRLRIENLLALPLEVDEIRVGTNWNSVAGAIASGPPVVTRQPISTNVYQGSDVQFLVEAAGAVPLTYQWTKDGSPVANGTNAVLTLTNIQPSQAGVYRLTVVNNVGTTNSNPATLGIIAFTNINVGLQALWHFDEKSGLVALDATANHNDGALVNFPGDNSQWIPSDFNGALSFSGSNYVEVPDRPSIGSALLNRFSLATWMRSRVTLTANGQTYRMLEKENMYFLLQGDGSATGLGVGGVSVLVKKGGANLTAGVVQALEANTWYHIAATYDGATLSIYLDGQLKSTRAVAAPLDAATLPLHIGSDYVAATNGTRYFPGAMDEVALWDRPLLPSEILQLSGQTGAPTILDQPQPQTRFVGGSAIFQVRARGQGPLRYLWLHGTNEIRSATSNVLVLSNIQLSDAGDYRCRVSNDVGETLSSAGTLTVVPVNSITDGSEAFWKFDETSGLVAADSSGRARNGQLIDFPDSTSQWVAGQVNRALNFDGQSNRVAVTGSGGLNLGSDATFAFWIRPTSYGTLQNAGTFLLNTSRILRKGTHFDIEAVDDPGSVRATIRANGVPAQQNALQLNQWQHFAIVFQGGMVSFYKNGFRFGDPAPALIGATNTNSVVLGNFVETLASTNLFAGAMDEVGIWGRPLSESEILGLAGRDTTGAPLIVSQPQSASRYVGGSVAFFVDATGKRPITYTWRHDSAVIPDSNTNRLVVTNLTAADAGGYTVTLQNSVGSATSTPAANLVVQQVTNVANGLVAYWKFDETNGAVFTDSSGHGHNAALQNATAVSGSVGVVGGAFNFDGVNDFAIVPHAPDLNLSDQVSISVWVNPRSLGVTGGLNRMVRKDINFDFMVVLANTTFQVFGENKTAYTAPANSIATNQWQQLGVVARDNTLQFFKNGRALGPPVPGRFGPENTKELIIANFGPDLSIVRLFDGFMDEMGIWNRALSVEEMDGVYQNGLAGKPLDAPFIPFQIRSINLPTPSKVRLVYYSPYTGQPHAVQRGNQIDQPQWTNQAGVVYTDLGGSLTEALFDKPPGNSAFYRVTVLPPSDVFFENFENGAVGWTHGGSGDNWELGTPVNGPGHAYSGTKVYATSLTGNVLPFSDNYLRSPSISLAGLTRATLSFQEWRNVDPDPTFHGTIVNVLDAASKAVLTQLSVQAGSTGGQYQLRTLPIPPQILGRTVIFEFKLYCDGFNLLEGWYVDDVKVSPQ